MIDIGIVIVLSIVFNARYGNSLSYGVFALPNLFITDQFYIRHAVLKSQSVKQQSWAKITASQV